MWFFNSPKIYFGEDALCQLDQIQGRRAVIVTDPVLESLGYVKRVQERLEIAGLETWVFAGIQGEPDLEIVRNCAAFINDHQPDWIVALGGGSNLDAAKAAWFVYERPDVDLASVIAIEQYGLRAKAHFITIPTTAGSGAEVTAAAIIKDEQAMRKLEISSFEFVADQTIIDPQFTARMPRRLTAETGLDALTHAIEGYSSSWANDFSDGLCLQATRLVFTYLKRAVENGENDLEAREKMANAATIAALGMSNSHIALAHTLGHSAGALLSIPHGRVTGLFLPYSIEFTGRNGGGRYLDLARIVGLCDTDEVQAALNLSQGIKQLMVEIGLPVSLKECGIPRDIYDAQRDALCERAYQDLSLGTARRVPAPDEMQKLFDYAYEGIPIDF